MGVPRGSSFFSSRLLVYWINGLLPVIAEELVAHSHRVEHIARDGSVEVHEAGTSLPNFIVQEESKLRKVSAMRKAGELHRPDKSSVSRSTDRHQ